jgi:hypothetical protein
MQRAARGDLTERPLTNVDEFRHRPVNELAALLPDEQAVDAAIKDLQTANKLAPLHCLSEQCLRLFLNSRHVETP